MEKEAPRSLWEKIMGGLSMPPPNPFGGSAAQQAYSNLGMANGMGAMIGNSLQYPYRSTSTSAAALNLSPKGKLPDDGNYYACVKEISNGFLIHVVTSDGKEIQRSVESADDIAANIQAALMSIKLKG